MRAKQELATQTYHMVLVFICISTDVITEKTDHSPPRKIPASREFRMPTKLSSREIVNSWIHPLYHRMRKRSHLIVFLKRRYLGLWTRMGLSSIDIPNVLLKSEASSPAWETTAEIFAEIATEAKKHGLPTLYVTIPSDYQVNRELGLALVRGSGLRPDQVDLEQSTRILEERLTQQGLPVYNSVAALRENFENGVPMYGRVDRHLTPEAHELIARELQPLVLPYFAGDATTK